jgi:hypothetical protein
VTADHPQKLALTAKIHAEMALHGLFPALEAEIIAGRETAAGLIGPEIAGENAFLTVHRRTRAGVFVYRQDRIAQGFLGVILLRDSGLRKLESDRFDALQPDLTDICEAGEAPAAVYGWGFAATTVRASGACVLGLMALRDRLFPQLPFFCRAATPQGAKVILGKMGYRPHARSATGLLVRLPDLECAA